MSRIEARLQRIEQELEKRKPAGPIIVVYPGESVPEDVPDGSIIIMVTYEGSEPDKIEGEDR